MKQVITTRIGGDMLDVSLVAFYSVWGSTGHNATLHTSHGLEDSAWPAAGTLRNLFIANDVDTAVWTLYKNGVATALAAISTSSVALNVTDDVTVAADDLIVLRRNGPIRHDADTLPMCASLEFESSDTITSVYNNQGGVSNSIGSGGVFGNAMSGTPPSNAISLCPLDGTITRLLLSGKIQITDALKGVTCTIYKNGVAQDGSGGTANTTVTKMAVAPGAYLVSSTFALTVAPGDTLEAFVDFIGAVGANDISAGYGVVLEADTAGQFAICGSNQTDAWSTPQSYGSVPGAWSDLAHVVGGEFNVAGVSSITLTGLQWSYNTPYPFGTSTLSLLKNGAVPANQPTITIVNNDTYVIDSNVSHIVQLDYGDYFAMIAAQGTTVSVQAHWSFVAAVTSTPPIPPATVTYATRRVRRFSLPPTEGNKRMFIRKLEFLMETGVGLTTGQGSDPQVMLRISRDWGHSFGTERWESAGPLGQYKRRVIFRNCGYVRSGGVVEIATSDPVPWTFLACDAQLELGTS